MSPAAVVLLAAARLAAAPMPNAAFRFSDVISISGSDVTALNGTPITRLTVFACAESCHPIPFQVDERDALGRWALDQGPEPNPDDSPGVFDDNDVLFFMAADAGERTQPMGFAGAARVAEIRIDDPLAGTIRWAYLAAFDDGAPRATTSYVQYDPAADRVSGARVSLGFRHGVPNYLAVRDTATETETNVLDRLKVRATATFLWGLLHFSRTEDDLSTEFVGWRQGPIRVIRCQRQRVRIGWGIRSPTFGSYTYFYRDFAELPVGLKLNFPPQYFFGNIIIRVVLDFRDLRGWSILSPSLPAPLPIDGTMSAAKAALNQLSDSWFALVGPEVSMVQSMDVSPSLATLRRRLLYREDHGQVDPPEDVPGEEPGIGYQLDRWGDVGAGAHRFISSDYALPPEVDAREFMRARDAPMQVSVQMLR